MTNLVLGLLTVALATNQPAAMSNLVKDTTGVTVSIPASTNDVVENELDALMIKDDAAMAEVDGWIKANKEFQAKGGGESREALNTRIIARFDLIRKDYTNLLAKYTNNDRIMVAYGSFLGDLGAEDESISWYEKAIATNPKNPAAWNQAANYYGHGGPVTNSFIYYQKAMELNPAEMVYVHNLATTVYMFRKDAREYYHLTEQEVFDKALDLYFKAEKLEPDNFDLAQDVAECYYGIKPFRGEDALRAWTNALNRAETPLQQEGVNIHLARVKLILERYPEVQHHLELVTNAYYDDLKARITRNLNNQKHSTNTPLYLGEKALTNSYSPEGRPASTNNSPTKPSESALPQASAK